MSIESMQWFPIETAPKNQRVLIRSAGDTYIAWLCDKASDEYDVVTEDEDGRWFLSDGKHDYPLRWPNVTHWMPLPGPPK